MKLGYNLLTDWDMSISYLYDLQFIDLSFNQIYFISPRGFEKLSQILDVTKVQIDIQNNDFQCSCESLDFFIRLQKYHTHVQGFNNLSCQSENRKYQNLATVIEKLKLICNSKIALILSTPACILLSLAIIIGALIYRYRWQIRYWYYVAKRRNHNGYERLHNSKGYVFDAFMYYADDDRHFIAILFHCGV